MATAPDQIPDILGRYRVGSPLGEGGFAVVLRAHDEGLDAPVAIKVLDRDRAFDPDLRERFVREARLLRRVQNPNVVAVYDIGELDDGRPYFVMEFAGGGVVGDRFRDVRATDRDIQAVVLALRSGLGALHRAGIVHRDIKPGNILFDERGRPYLADFGVALTQDSTPGLTMTGIVLGTPGFLSPEQARGEPTTAASDIASLGATLFFAATGTSPYGAGDPNAILIRTARGKPDIPRDLDPGLAKLIVPMLDGRADRRPTAAALSGGPAGTTELPRLGARRPPTAALVLGASVVAIGMLALATSGGDGAEPVATVVPPTSEPCTPRRYLPCGATIPAPATDGDLCVDDHADYDEDPTNGCEAAPDRRDGVTIVDEVTATIVPAADTDRYRIEISDGGFDPLCAGRLRLTLTAPPNVALVLTLLDSDDRVLDRVVATASSPGTIDQRDPTCGRDDSGVYYATVEPEGVGRSPEPYVLTRSGDF